MQINDLTLIIQKARQMGSESRMKAMQSVLSAVQRRENTENKTLSPEEILGVIQKEAKEYRESAEAFKGRKEEHVLRQQAEILESFLPKKIEESEYPKIVKNFISEVGAKTIKDMGKVIGAAKKKYGISLDMKLFSTIVKEKLGK